ncbi:hypothetical protein Acr_17g0003330 [Actinidia rufa]|uniref:Uncharacterized protein n=1 Tax=Actinidia rufa TaxID=165716 RepID=A0A7J0G1U9_9ERIC|nr:hypothetical protein Acr_17g0003330 [Actinidia rufa]
MSAEMILSMDWSESVANSRMEAAFLCKSGDDVFRIPTSRATAAESKLCKRSQSMQICNKSIKCKLLVKSQVTDETCFSIYEKHETAMERESCRKSHSMWPETARGVEEVRAQVWRRKYLPSVGEGREAPWRFLLEFAFGTECTEGDVQLGWVMCPWLLERSLKSVSGRFLEKGAFGSLERNSGEMLFGEEIFGGGDRGSLGS